MTEQATLSGTYEYLIGGKEYTAPDVMAGDYIRSLWPSVSKWLTMTRRFLPAVAAQLKEEGVTHVVDFASGIPVNHIHNTLTGAKVVYSDIDLRTVEAGKKLTAKNPDVLYLQHDINKPLELLNSQEVQDFLGKIDKLAIGVFGVAAFLEPQALQAITEKLYHWAPPGTILYSEFDCKNPNKMTPNFQKLVELMASQLGAYHLYSLEQCRQAVHPWRIRHMTAAEDFLQMPAGYIQPEDREGVDLQFHVVIAEKP
jgi:hypothetical protein